MKGRSQKPEAGSQNRRAFLRDAGLIFTGFIWVPKPVAAQSILMADGLAALTKKKAAGGGGGSDTPFLSSVAKGTSAVRNNFTGTVGFRFTTGATGLTITALGRYIFSATSNSHTVSIFNSSAALLTSGAAPASASAGGFSWISITPFSLAASTTYFCVSQETSGDGDNWLQDDCTFSSTTAATVTGSAFSNGAGFSIDINGVKAFVPPNFEYH